MIPTRIVASRQNPEPESTFRVSRTSRFGNDYHVVTVKGKTPIYYVENKKTGYKSKFAIQSKEAVHKHAVEMFKIQMEAILEKDPAYYDILLGFKHISCFCTLDLPCHADAIIEHLKRREQELEIENDNEWLGIR